MIVKINETCNHLGIKVTNRCHKNIGGKKQFFWLLIEAIDSTDTATDLILPGILGRLHSTSAVCHQIGGPPSQQTKRMLQMSGGGQGARRKTLWSTTVTTRLCRSPPTVWNPEGDLYVVSGLSTVQEMSVTAVISTGPQSRSRFPSGSLPYLKICLSLLKVYLIEFSVISMLLIG